MPDRMLIAANWKMNKTCADAEEAFVNIEALVGPIDSNLVEILICPTSVSLQTLCIMARETDIRIGAQNIYPEDQSAMTGEVCADIVRSAGADYVIVGHSERRINFGEDDEAINLKFRSALKTGLKPILCIGESLDERKAMRSENVILGQLKNGLVKVRGSELKDCVIAYEPVWAISTSGTGIVAAPEEAEEMHRFIRNSIAGLYSRKIADSIRILYGGSVTPANAKELLSRPGIDGALIGGASLNPKSFAEIALAAQHIMKSR